MTDRPVLDTLLFDLDDTLLGNRTEAFLPRYFALLGEYAQPLFPDRRRLFQELMHGTQAMTADTDPARTNREIFWDAFVERTGLEREETERFFNRFYEEQFHRLRDVTQKKPVAARLVNCCLERGYRVAVATNPLFPRSAIEHRLAWAGLPVSEFDFALVTTYENMHASKPHRAYYEEILAHIKATPETTMMVGDDWENDIAPAVALGMRAFWIAAPDTPRPVALADDSLLAGAGSLEDVYQWLCGESAAPGPAAA